MNVSNLTKLISGLYPSSARKDVALNYKRRHWSSSTDRDLLQLCINPRLKIMEYAIRGSISLKANEIENEMRKGIKKPFTQVIKANLGDCHAMGQTPITFIRQILALVSYPKLLNDECFPKDVKDRAKAVLESCKGGSVGSYSESAGIEMIRKQVAKYIEARDGFPSDWNDITLSAGASDGIRNVVKLVNCKIDGKKPGIMIPVPQFPLYSALLEEYDMYRINYLLDEANNWGLNVFNLQETINQAKKVCSPVAIVVINPGNPTGQVLNRKNIEDVIKFAHKENLLIMADEVYQMNVHSEGSTFFSFKQTLMEMGPPYNKHPLVSFMSCSKCYMSECGLRGGYAEIINLTPEMRAVFAKSLTVKLCPTVLGQVTMYAVANEPQKGEPSYDQFVKEKHNILESLKKKAKIVEDKLNAIEGYKCNTVQGAMYAFPQIMLPLKAIEAAKKKNIQPDEFYALQMLEQIGISVVPGSGFGQAEGTYHFRTTILPPLEQTTQMLNRIKVFHEDFLKKYG